jgi:oligopeptide/dipeptide ABC transporter ATP-binding protein
LNAGVDAPTTNLEARPVLEVNNLQVGFETAGGVLAAVRGVSLSVGRGEVLGIVGESGSGKSMTCLSLLGLLPRLGRITGGSVRFQGQDLIGMSEKERRSVLGSRIGTILQDPMTSLNPAFTIGEQVAEVLRVHRGMRGAALRDEVVSLLERVQIPSPALRLRDYPHMMSGGMRQRIVAAIAIACGPELLIADEPTSALDVTTSAHFLRLLASIQRSGGMSAIVVTHDFGVVRQICDRVAVMYAGRIVETGDVDSMLASPHHPYTRALIASVPDLDASVSRLEIIGGEPPRLVELDEGCAFRTRCSRATVNCGKSPPIVRMPDGQYECWNGFLS